MRRNNTTNSSDLIRKPTSCAACRHWAGNPGPCHMQSTACLHPMLWRALSEWPCSRIRAAGHCPYGRTPLDNNESGKDENDEI